MATEVLDPSRASAKQIGESVQDPGRGLPVDRHFNLCRPKKVCQFVDGLL